MGYDLGRFIGAIDQEFYCAICTMVLEDPLQSPCDHLFCSKCIKDWLVVDKSCPVDRRSLTLDGFKPPARYFLNMLDKLDINCSFQPEGCEKVLKLEHLQIHIARCEYSSQLEMMCDKGCDLKVKRSEYKKNCFAHLIDHFTSKDKKVFEITHALNAHNRQEVTILNEEVIRLQEQVIKLSRNVTSQQKHITKLDNELKRLRHQSANSVNTVNRQGEEIEKSGDISTTLIQTSPDAPPQWQKCFNMSMSIGQPNILEFGHNSGSAFAQSLQPLNQENTCFKIQILSDCGLNSIGIGIGLTQKGHPIDVPPGHSEGSIGYRCCGKLIYDKCESFTSPACKINDIIECGVKFPKNYINNGSYSVVVYFAKNSVAFLKKLIRMPFDGLFPTIYMFDVHLGTTVKIQYMY